MTENVDVPQYGERFVTREMTDTNDIAWVNNVKYAATNLEKAIYESPDKRIPEAGSAAATLRIQALTHLETAVMFAVKSITRS